MIDIIYVLLIIIAIFIVCSKILRHAVIGMCILSLLSSLTYLLLKAYDVAIAEAVIGSTFGTVLYLIALKRYKEYIVFYINNDKNFINENVNHKKLLAHIKKFAKNEELDAQIVYTDETLEKIYENHKHDLILIKDEDFMEVHLPKENKLAKTLVESIKLDKGISRNNIKFIFERNE